MNDSECIFCKIAAGEIPATKILDENQVIAFMDIGPIIKGHVLVIPRDHYPDIISVPPDVLSALIVSARRVAAAQVKALNADGVNIIQNNGRSAGQLVPHFHIHVIPRFNDDGYHFNWNPGKYSSPEEMEETAASIRSAL